MADRLTYENVITYILERVPELEPTYQHLVATEGPTERYTFIFAAEEFAFELCYAREDGLPPEQAAAAEETLRRLLAIVEEGLTSGDAYLDDLMGTGFLEAMDPDDVCFDYLLTLMGPESRRVTKEIFGPAWVRTDLNPPKRPKPTYKPT